MSSVKANSPKWVNAVKGSKNASTTYGKVARSVTGIL